MIIIPANTDNYVYLCEYEKGRAFAVDPSQAGPVVAELESRGLKLTHILITHGHHDHTGGVGELKKRFGCEVIDADSIGMKRSGSFDETSVQIGKLEITAMPTPGHTADGVSYLVPASGDNRAAVFTGDTLFAAGCGRVFGGDFEAMFKSLKRLASLEPETLVYPGHNYTVENLEFAMTIEPESADIRSRLEEMKKRDRLAKPTVPSTIAGELDTNVFIRAGSVEDFRKLRKAKDRF